MNVWALLLVILAVLLVVWYVVFRRVRARHFKAVRHFTPDGSRRCERITRYVRREGP